MDRERFEEIWGSVYIVQEKSEFNWLLNHVEELKPTRILEIGVEAGGSFKFWEQLLPPGGLLIGVDINPFTAEKIAWPWNSSRVVKLVIGDSLDPETVKRVEEALEGGLADFLFIDGNHDLPHVSGDFRNYSRLIRGGGLVGFHDVGSGESGQFFNSLPGRKERFSAQVNGIGTGVWYKP